MKSALLLAAVASSWADPGPIDRWAQPIAEASARFGVPQDWIRRVMRVESGGRTSMNGRPTVSSAGAMGLMQLMPGTWQSMRALHNLGADPHQPRDNILAGTAYLRAMYDQFGYPGLFAAYNAGPGRYARHLLTGRQLSAETRAYQVKVLAGSRLAPPARIHVPASTQLTLFAVQPRPRPSQASSEALDNGGGTLPQSLFVPLRGSRR